MQETSKMLNSAREKSVNDIKKLQSELEAAVQRIRVRRLFFFSIQLVSDLRTSCLFIVYDFALQLDPKIKATEIDALFSRLVNEVNKQMAGLQDMVKQQKIAEEQERLRKIQQEMELDKRRKDEEEAKKKEDEDNRKKKVEIEARRKAEEEQRRRQEEEDKKTAASLQVHKITDANEEQFTLLLHDL